MVSLLQEAEPMRVRAALSRDGVEVYGEALYLHNCLDTALCIKTVLVIVMSSCRKQRQYATHGIQAHIATGKY